MKILIHSEFVHWKHGMIEYDGDEIEEILDNDHQIHLWN